MRGRIRTRFWFEAWAAALAASPSVLTPDNDLIRQTPLSRLNLRR